MIVVGAYQNKKVGVFGLARSGLAACRSLAAGGAEVLAWDDNRVQRDQGPTAPIDLYGADFLKLSALVVSPGVPLTYPEPHALVLKARTDNVPVIGDIELFAFARADLPKHQVVGVTGTNGKSTTTALLTHVLKFNNYLALAAGNIGIPVLDIDPLEEGGIYVFELSSFQLDQTNSLQPEVAILLNISPDHLDRHGTMDEYVSAKRQIFEMQSEGGLAIIGVDDTYGREMVATLAQKVIPISCEKAVENGVYVLGGVLYDATEGPAKKMGPLGNNRALRGTHNGQNAAAVYAAAKTLGVRKENIIPAFDSFQGLPHRLEIVAEDKGIVFINDSKASNTGSALRSLEAFEDVYWIVGGLFKEDTLEMFEPVLGHVKKAFLIGEDDTMFRDFLTGKVTYLRCHTLDIAVKNAAKEAKQNGGGVVLLAPACASFDQFKNFEHRGETFRETALEIIKGENA
ncbi:MAG: UDP-N-acetylmuramoyl-L-alanine--D-glutamate ligase [Sphingomonadales bacterium]